MQPLTCVWASEMEVWVVQGEGWSSWVSGHPYAQASVLPTEVSHLTPEGIFPITLHPVFRIGEIDLEWVVVSSNRSEAGPIGCPPPLVHVVVVGGGGLWEWQS